MPKTTPFDQFWTSTSVIPFLQTVHISPLFLINIFRHWLPNTACVWPCVRKQTTMHASSNSPTASSTNWIPIPPIPTQGYGFSATTSMHRTWQLCSTGVWKCWGRGGVENLMNHGSKRAPFEWSELLCCFELELGHKPQEPQDTGTRDHSSSTFVLAFPFLRLTSQ